MDAMMNRFRAASNTMSRRLGRSGAYFTLILACIIRPVPGSTIAVTGVITQSTADTAIPAVGNPSLNNIADGDTYVVTMSFNGQILSPGSYNLTSTQFTDTSKVAAENGFVSGALVVSQSGGADQLSVLACLSDCSLGNQLALEFSIPASQIGSGGAASSIPGLLPMDLLEDDGSTDIQGNVLSYSQKVSRTGAPEPASLVLVALSLIAIGSVRGMARIRALCAQVAGNGRTRGTSFTIQL